MWDKGDWVVVISGTFEKGDTLKDVSFVICEILEEGVDDLHVKPQQISYGWAKKSFFVPKSRCQYIPVNPPGVYEEIRKPQVGDLVYYYYAQYNGKITKSVSHVWELKHGTENAPEALITIEGTNQWVSIEDLLVLEEKN